MSTSEFEGVNLGASPETFLHGLIAELRKPNVQGVFLVLEDDNTRMVVQLAVEGENQPVSCALGGRPDPYRPPVVAEPEPEPEPEPAPAEAAEFPVEVDLELPPPFTTFDDSPLVETEPPAPIDGGAEPVEPTDVG